jgi:hypothetical protein
MRSVALVVCLGLFAGCFGYNSSAKKWAYVGDSVLMAGGAAAIAGDLATRPGPCMGMGCPTYTPPFSGALLAGTMLVSAGVFGMLFNATRPTVKTSR